jgi:hypothetical protein
MLQPCDELSLGGESADELGVVGEPRMDDLDRDLPPHLGLECPVHRAEGSLS